MSAGHINSAEILGQKQMYMWTEHISLDTLNKNHKQQEQADTCERRLYIQLKSSDTHDQLTYSQDMSYPSSSTID